MNVKEKKERISDVMAIYIVRPTEENFKIINNDLERSIFDNYYINFVEKCEESILTSFFSDLVHTGNYNRIYKIQINPFGFFLYHPQVFSLNIPNTYTFINSPGTKETEINSYFDQVGTGIFNALFTLRTVPIIKYRTGWFAENIVNVIQNNFNSTFDKFPELKEEFPRRNNSLLVILDRDTDLPIMFHHSASLGSMTNDVFGLTRSKSKDNKFEIDPLTDYIWNSYLSTSFVTAKEKIIEELKSITEQTSFLDQTKNNTNDLEKVSEKLNSTLEGLRDITIKQGILNNHAKFQEKLSKEIDERSLGQFYSLEESILNKRTINNEFKKKFYDIISLKTLKVNDLSTSKIDILRLCLIYYLISQKLSNDEIKEIEKFLSNIGTNLDSLEYLKQKRLFEESMRKGNNTTTDSGFLQKSFSFFVNRIGSLMNTEQPSMVADISNSLASNKEVNNFVSYNLLKKGLDKINSNFNQVIIFIVGGGSLAEYEYVDELLTKNNRNVTK